MEKDNIKSQFFTTYEETEAWLKDMEVEDYTINNDLIIDVNGDVNIFSKKLEYIPVQFGYVHGSFYCSQNNLTTLKGSPKIVNESFFCNNNNLQNFKGSPKFVGGSFYCSNNSLTSLEGYPKKIERDLYCNTNPLKDFYNLEFEVKGNICFTPINSIDYLDYYKDSDGDILINFNNFKKLQALQKLNEKLDNDLSVKPVKIKHKI